MPDELFSSLLGDFFLDAKERVGRIEGIFLAINAAEMPTRDRLLEEAKRELHTLKGNSGMMGLKDLQSLAHMLEDLVSSFTLETPDVEAGLAALDGFRRTLDACSRVDEPSGQVEESPAKVTEFDPGLQGGVRVPFEALDELVDLLAEMVIFKNRLSEAIGRGPTVESAAQAWEDVAGAHEALGKTLVYIQDRIMQLRMVPLKMLFGHLRRIVHDESRAEDKQVTLETIGGDTPMDKALLEVAGEALGHLVRNAVVHGIERPAERRHAKKEAGGCVHLSATIRGNEVHIEVGDDGRGIDMQALEALARERAVSVADDQDLYSLLFAPGVSTKQDADMSAGRGMGLSAALQSVQRMGGRIEVTSEKGRGSHFSIHLPLSVSIMPALLVSADGEEYAIPLTAVVEIVHLRPGEGHLLNHAGVFTWRRSVLPLLDLGYIFGTNVSSRGKGYVVVIGAEGKNRGILADDITGMREIVVKGLDPMVGQPRGISGSTILGDGRVLLILDPSGLMTIRPFIDGGRGRAPDEAGANITESSSGLAQESLV